MNLSQWRREADEALLKATSTPLCDIPFIIELQAKRIIVMIDLLEQRDEVD